MGFNKEDTVYLYRDFMSFLYSVNENVINNDNKLFLNYGFLFESPPSIVIKSLEEEIKYHCVRSNSEDDIWFDKHHHIKGYPDNRKYTRHYSMYGYYSSVVRDDYKLNISLYDGIKVYDNENIEILSCDKEIEEYLVSLNFPVKIDEVYKRVCEIIGQEIGKYLTIKIEVSKIIDSNSNYIKYDNTDIIQVDNGELLKFGITIDNKTIFVDGDNNWSYKITKDDGKTLSYSLSTSNGNLDYNVNESDNKDFQMVFSQNFEEARSEVDKVKTRVRNILKK